jgi:hypothetical protein
MSTFYFRHFKEPDALFGPILFKVKSGGLDGVLVMEPPFACSINPSILDRLLCEGYPVTFRLTEDFAPELSNFIQFQCIRGPSLHLHTLAGPSLWLRLMKVCH